VAVGRGLLHAKEMVRQTDEKQRLLRSTCRVRVLAMHPACALKQLDPAT
jgi:hypothetical protein